ncbi:MAG: helix-turn-helix transcriptional regulator, partial [Eubacterium sp.]|nr:helix-turn-helix transcriptional regulator [Eubacterium sp.]
HKVTELRLKKNIKQKDLLARLQINGVDISPSALSKLEGQTRPVTDIELKALAKILETTADELLE